MFTIIQKGFLFLLTLSFALLITGCGSSEGECCEDGSAISSLVKNIEIKEGHDYSFTLPTSDENGNTLHYELYEKPSHGSLSGEIPNVIYIPNNGFVGTDTVKYKVKVEEVAITRATDVTLKDVGIYTVYIVVTEHKHAPFGTNDAVTTNENSPVLIDVLKNDEDTTSIMQILSITNLTQPSHGVAEIVDNKVKYTPAANYIGVDTFTYTPSNDTGDGNVTTVSINISDINNIPVGVADTITINEDALSVTLNVLANDTDADGDTLFITNLTMPSKGTLEMNGNIFTYTPNINAFGTDTFTYTPNDGAHDGNVVTVTINITNVNDKPLSTDDTATTLEDTPVIINVLANDADADADAITITNLSNPLYGTVVIEANKIVYTPNPNISDINDTFTYTPYDGTVDGPVTTVTVTISNVNDAPIGSIDNVGMFEDNTTIIEVLKNDIDLDGDTLSITNLQQPLHGKAEIIGTTIKYTPNENYNGTDIFTYTPNDGIVDGNKVTVKVTVTPLSDTPLGVDDGVSIDEDADVTIDVLGNDIDGDNDPLSIENLTNPENGTVEIIDGKVKYTPVANDHGTFTFTYTPYDGTNYGNVTKVTVVVKSVNDKPVGEADSAETEEDSNIKIEVLTNDKDIDGDTLKIENLTQPSHGTTEKDGTSITYTPDANFNGTDTFQYTPNDGTANGDAVTVTIIVTPVADVPIGVDDKIIINEDADAITIDVLANDTDVDGDALTITNLKKSDTFGEVTIVDNKIDYTPELNAHGTETFTYIPFDGTKAGNVTTVTITINDVNDAPTTNAVSGGTTPEDTPKIITISGKDSDDGDIVDYDAVAVENCTVSLSETTVTVTPSANFFGTAKFKFRVKDDDGDWSEYRTVSVEVTSVNDAPVGVNDSVTTAEDTSISINVLANDTDVERDAISIGNFTQGNHGVVTVTTNKTTAIYTPNPNFNGTDTFTYIPNDGTDNGNETTVTVTVTAVRDAIIGVDDIVETSENKSVLIDVLANDTNVDGVSLIIKLQSNPSNGSVALKEDSTKIEYTPKANYFGTDTFTYKPNDGTVATVTVTIKPCMEEIWNKTYDKSGGEEEFLGSAIDGDGNIYAVGYVFGTDGLIVKYDSAGNKKWFKTYTPGGQGGINKFTDIKIDSDGNLYIVGTTDIDNDAWLLITDTSGGIISEKTFGGTQIDEFSHLILDADDNIYAVGFTTSSDEDITDGNNGGKDALIVKFNSNGDKQWNKTIGGTADDSFSSVVIDDAGNLYAVGYSASKDDDITDGNLGGKDALIVKLNSAGEKQWDKTVGGDSSVGDGLNDDEFNGIAIDGANLYASGYTISRHDALSHGLIYKFDLSSGTNEMLEATTTGLNRSYTDIAVDKNGDIYVSGTESDKAVLARYSSAADKLCERVVSNSSFSSVAIGNDDSVFSSGELSSDALIYKWKPLND